MINYLYDETVLKLKLQKIMEMNKWEIKMRHFQINDVLNVLMKQFYLENAWLNPVSISFFEKKLNDYRLYLVSCCRSFSNCL